MEWIFSAFLVVSIIHMGEEYFYPGGFMDAMKRLSPRLAPFVDAPMAIIVNGLQLLLCIAAIVMGQKALVFSMKTNRFWSSMDPLPMQMQVALHSFSE